ncbi:uncharacterized protein LOC120695188 [Panicum virgatum]|uniref:uncharacterized protein LOC120695188 n=1 Tax=Panicum virgatum TaxID=38727 RepID=UPI0019D64BD3|nr:uncharacterized protein LOC120695188 [Panicum virgatum]
MAAAIIVNFHQQRVIPLTERSLPIFGLTPGVPASGSRMSMVLLPRGIANDLWEIKMRPKPGYLSVGAVKKWKEAEEAAADRKRKRKEKHDKACKIAHAEAKLRPATPESTHEEEDTSDAEVNLPGDDEAATGEDSPPVYQGAGDEDASVMLREARPTPGLLMDPPLAGVERRSPTPAAAGRSSTPMTERRSPLPATGEGTPAQTASRLQADPRMTPLDQSSRGVNVPRARRSGTVKRTFSSLISRSGAVTKDAASLAPAKALKTVARATPHTAPQPPLVVDIVATAAKLREAMPRGAQAAQQARAPGNGGNASQSGVEAATQADAMGEAGRGGADDATRPDVEVKVGRSDADSVAQPVAEEGAGGDAQEHPSS